MSYLQKIKENNNYKEENKIPFLIENKRVRQVRSDHLKHILSSDIFEFDNRVITLKSSLKTFKERTDALTLFAEKMLANGLSNP